MASKKTKKVTPVEAEDSFPESSVESAATATPMPDEAQWMSRATVLIKMMDHHYKKKDDKRLVKLEEERLGEARAARELQMAAEKQRAREAEDARKHNWALEEQRLAERKEEMEIRQQERTEKESRRAQREETRREEKEEERRERRREHEEDRKEWEEWETRRLGTNVQKLPMLNSPDDLPAFLKKLNHKWTSSASPGATGWRISSQA